MKIHNYSLNSLLVFFLSVLAFISANDKSYSTSYTWTGATNHNWNTTTNWTPNGTPGSSDNVTLNSSGNSPTLQNNVTVTNLTITGGTFDCNGDTIIVNGASSFGTCTITNGLLKLRSSSNVFAGTTMDIPVDAVVGTIQFNGGTFNKKVIVEITSTSVSTSNGGNTFNDTLSIYRSNAGNGTVTLANTTANTYNKLVTLRNVGSGGLQTTGTGRSKFNENIVIECSGAGGISIGTVGGGDTLANGKTITIGSNGFTAGTLVLRNFVQVGSTPQSLTLSATTFNLIGCTFNGDVVFSANALLWKQTVFNGKANLTNSNTANTTVTCDGGNTFNGSATINQTGTGNSNRYRLGVTLNDTFNDSLVLFCASGGELRPAYGDTTSVSGHVVYSGYVSTGYSGSGVLRFTGSNAQNFTVNNHLVYHIYIDKTANDVTLLGHMTILTAGSLNFNSGKLICTSSNYITMASGSSTTGANNNSFVSGPIEKTGNTAFVFPIGKGSKYMPLEMTSFTATNTWDDFTAEYFNSGQSLGYAKDTIIRYISGCDYWRLARTNNTPNARIKLVFDSSACSISDSASLRIANWNGTKWRNSGNGGMTGNRYVGTISDSATITNTQFVNYYALANSQCFLTANAGTDKSLCAGDSVTIGASPVASSGSGTITYSWSPSTALSSISTANPKSSPSTNTNYIVSITDAMGCSKKDTMVVNYHTLPSANAGSDTSFCSGDSITIGASPTASGGGSPYTYSWSPSSGLSGTSLSNPKASPISNTTYVLTVTDNYGCIKRDTVSVSNSTISYTWTGAVSGVWENAYNWSPSGIPGVCDNVLIVSSSNNPAISGYTEVNAFSIQSGTLDVMYGLKIFGKAKFSGGTINNGYIEIGNNDTTIFNGAHMNTQLYVITPKLYFNGSVFDQETEFYHTGGDVISKGGNTFNNYFDITTSQNGALYLASEEKDVFMDGVALWLSSPKSIFPAYTKNMEVRGNIYVGNASNAADDSLIFFGKNGGKLILNGSSNQTLQAYSYGNDTIVAIKKCEINKSSGAVTFNSRITITDSLIFAKGKIITDSINCLIMAANSFCTGSSDSSFVNGPVKKIGNTAFSFPTGKGTSYRPIEITAPSNASDAYTAEYFDAEQNLGDSTSSSINYISRCDYWNLNRTNGTSNVSVKLAWDSLKCGAVELDSLHIAKWDGAKWSDQGNGGITGNLRSGKIVTANAQSTFGYFALAHNVIIPAISFSHSDTIIKNDTAVFVNTSSDIASGTKFYWRFDSTCVTSCYDSTTSISQSISHTFKRTGSQQVKLFAISYYGDTVVYTKSVTVLPDYTVTIANETKSDLGNIVFIPLDSGERVFQLRHDVNGYNSIITTGYFQSGKYDFTVFNSNGDSLESIKILVGNEIGWDINDFSIDTSIVDPRILNDTLTYFNTAQTISQPASETVSGAYAFGKKLLPRTENWEINFFPSDSSTCGGIYLVDNSYNENSEYKSSPAIVAKYYYGFNGLNALANGSVYSYSSGDLFSLKHTYDKETNLEKFEYCINYIVWVTDTTTQNMNGHYSIMANPCKSSSIDHLNVLFKNPLIRAQVYDVSSELPDSGQINLTIPDPFPLNEFNGKWLAENKSSENIFSENDDINGLNAGIYSYLYSFKEYGIFKKQEQTFEVANKIEWNHLINSNLRTGDSALQKTGGVNNYDDAGAVSINKLESEQNGWIEFKIDDPSKNLDFGFSDITGDTNAPAVVQYGFLIADGIISVGVYSNNTVETALTIYAKENDVLRIHRMDSSILFIRNNILLATYETDNNSELLVSATLNSSNAAIADARCSFKAIPVEEDKDASLNTICTNDEEKNWVYTITYDLDGRTVTSESKVFADALGRETQSQTKLLTEKKVLVAQTIYDADGRKVIGTLPAPIDQQDLCYYNNFIKNPDDGEYTYDDFDKPNTSSDPNTGEVDHPKSVTGALADYYSENNVWEKYVATTSFPYSRVAFDDDNSGRLRRASSVGEDLRMGSGHEQQTYTMPAAGELFYVFGFAQGWYDTDLTVENLASSSIMPAYKVYKQITKDVNGRESIAFHDMDGKLIATCLSGQVSEENVKEEFVRTNGSSIVNYVDIHLPQGCETSLEFVPYETTVVHLDIIDLSTGKFIYTDVNSLDFPELSPGYYRFVARNADEAHVNESTFQNYWLHSLFNYDLNYYNWTLYYYDKAGRLTKVVSPEGVDQSVNMGSSYASTYSEKNIEDFYRYQYWKIPDSGDPDYNWWFEPDNLPDNNSQSNYGYFTDLNFAHTTVSPFCFCDQRLNMSLNLPVSPGSGGDPIKYTLITVSGAHKNVTIPTENELSRTAGNEFRLGASIEDNSNETYLTTYQDNENDTIAERVDGACLTYRYWYYVEFILTFYNGTTYVASDESGFYFHLDYYITSGGIVKQWVFDSEDDYIFQQMYSSPDVQNATSVVLTLKRLQDFKSVPFPQNSCWTDFDNVEPNVFDFLADLKIYMKGTKVSGPYIPQHTLTNSYEYNSLGWTLSSTTPDEGKTEYVYMNDGRIRFSQDAKQRASNEDVEKRKFSFVSYDNDCRIVETGEFNPSNVATSTVFFENYQDFINGTNGNTNSSVHNPLLLSDVAPGSLLLDEDCRTQSNFIKYDEPDDDNIYDSDLPYPEYSQKYMMGIPVKTWNINSTTWYSFDELGRLTWTVKRIKDMNGVGSDAYKTMNYTYRLGNLVKTAYNKNDKSERFFHHFKYDADQRLSSVYTSKNNKILDKQASFYYYLHGPIKRIEIGDGLQAQDIVYTINGWLKGINSPDLDPTRDPGHDGSIAGSNHFAADMFGFSLDYFTGDYKRDNTFIQSSNLNDGTTALDLYSGIIKTQRWNNNVPSYWVGSSGIQHSNTPLVYAFNYDHKYQLAKATFGTITGNGTQNSGVGEGDSPAFDFLNEYKISELAYDLNGNIKKLTRAAYDGTHAMDELTYNYTSGTNKLQKVTDAIHGYTYAANEVKDGQGNDNYEYNEIGELVADHLNNKYYDYDAYGNVTDVYSDASSQHHVVSFTYDENGTRLSKSSYADPNNPSTTIKTWYVYDASGNPLGVYESQPAVEEASLKELPVYGLGRMGSYDRGLGKMTYVLDDQLGNVRSTFVKEMKTSFYTGFETADTYNYIFRNEHVGSKPSGTGKALGLQKDTPGEFMYGGDVRLIVHPGDIVTVQYDSYFNSAGLTPDAKLVFHLFDRTGTQFKDWMPGNISAVNNNWNTNNFSYTVPVSLPAGDYVLNLYFLTESSADKVWFDNVSINVTENSVTAGTSGVALPHKESLTDYYAHGSVMPGRSYISSFYRFGYQGQNAEQDPETGLNSFELRMYDPLIARWTSADPYGQFHSPFLAMGNNPISQVDPRGGISFNWSSALVGAGIGAAVGTGIGLLTDKDHWYNYTLGFAIMGGAIGGLSGPITNKNGQTLIPRKKPSGHHSFEVNFFYAIADVEHKKGKGGQQESPPAFPSTTKIKGTSVGNITQGGYNSVTLSDWLNQKAKTGYKPTDMSITNFEAFGADPKDGSSTTTYNLNVSNGVSVSITPRNVSWDLGTRGADPQGASLYDLRKGAGPLDPSDVITVGITNSLKNGVNSGWIDHCIKFRVRVTVKLAK